VGALMANVLGTTGASMLLIRPWLRANKYRVTAHHVVFFIFIVSNAGGCLTPVGDPPLFLGYLNGVPFWWVAQHGWLIWLTGVAILLAMFYVVDARNYARAPKPVRQEQTDHERWRFDGLANLFFLALVLGAVFVNHPPFLREALMIGAALGSYFTTRESVHAAPDQGSRHSVHWNICDHDAGAGLAGRQRRQARLARARCFLFWQRCPFQRARQCADLPQLLQRAARSFRGT
jgi:Na+/H+ antiporter NhaD/arsenite permease-like protein